MGMSGARALQLILFNSAVLLEKKKMPQVSGVLFVCLRCLLIFVLNFDFLSNTCKCRLELFSVESNLLPSND